MVCALVDFGRRAGSPPPPPPADLSDEELPPPPPLPSADEEPSEARKQIERLYMRHNPEKLDELEEWLLLQEQP